MKKIYLMVLMLMPLSASVLFAQSKELNVEKVIESYSSNKNVEMVDISPQFLALMAGQSGDDKELLEKVSTLKVLSMNEGTASREEIATMVKSVRDAAQRDKYSQIMRVKADGSLVEMYSRDSVLLFLVEDITEGVILYINGKIDAELIKAVMDGKISIE